MEACVVPGTRIFNDTPFQVISELARLVSERNGLQYRRLFCEDSCQEMSDWRGPGLAWPEICGLLDQSHRKKRRDYFGSVRKLPDDVANVFLSERQSLKFLDLGLFGEIDRWRLDFNHHRIHSSLDYQSPAAYTAGCALPASATPPEQSHITNPNSLTQSGAKTGATRYSQADQTLGATFSGVLSDGCRRNSFAMHSICSPWSIFVSHGFGFPTVLVLPRKVLPSCRKPSPST